MWSNAAVLVVRSPFMIVLCSYKECLGADQLRWSASVQTCQLRLSLSIPHRLSCPVPTVSLASYLSPTASLKYSHKTISNKSRRLYSPSSSGRPIRFSTNDCRRKMRFTFTKRYQSVTQPQQRHRGLYKKEGSIF